MEQRCEALDCTGKIPANVNLPNGSTDCRQWKCNQYFNGENYNYEPINDKCTLTNPTTSCPPGQELSTTQNYNGVYEIDKKCSDIAGCPTTPACPNGPLPANLKESHETYLNVGQNDYNAIRISGGTNRCCPEWKCKPGYIKYSLELLMTL